MMPFRSRRLSWSAALREIRSDRIQFAPGERQANFRRQLFADLAGRHAGVPANAGKLLKGDSYDRAGIMRMAIASAQAHRHATGEPWGFCLSAALKGTWKAAKAARTAARWQEERRAVREQRHRVSPELFSQRGGSGEPIHISANRPRSPSLAAPLAQHLSQ